MKYTFGVVASMLLSVASVGAWASPDHEPPKAHAGRVPSAVAEDFRNGVDRTVIIESDARWVNVRRAEVIRFVVKTSGGTPREFIHRIDVLSNKPYPLSKLAPEDLASSLGTVMVYVTPDRISRR